MHDTRQEGPDRISRPVVRHVLIVDGQSASRETLGLAFRTWGYRPHMARDGAEAISIFEKVSPLLVVTELNLGRVSGLDVLRHFKAADPDVVVVFVTGCRSMADAKTAMRAGAADFLAKPPDYIRLKSLVDHVSSVRLPHTAEPIESLVQ